LILLESSGVDRISEWGGVFGGGLGAELSALEARGFGGRATSARRFLQFFKKIIHFMHILAKNSYFKSITHQ